MPPAEFFARFGLFVVRDFLDPVTGAEIISQAQASAWEKALVSYPDSSAEDELTRSERTRKTLKIRVPDDQRTQVLERLQSIWPALERHFEVKLAGFEEPQLLRYQEGHFFQGHRDTLQQATENSPYGTRQVSAVVFLNNPAEEPSAGCYGGGALVFAGLIDDPRARDLGFPLTGEAGLLVAFRSDLYHEVQPIAHGERYTIVTWFY